VNAVSIGDHSSIGDRTVVHVAKIQGDHPTHIGNYVTVGPGAIVHAATLHDRCRVGAGAQVLDGAVVQSHAVVAPGAVVTPHTVVPEKQLWAGSPAKFVRELTQEELDSITETAQDVIELAYIHAQECSKDVQQLHEEELEYEDKRVRDPEYIFQPRRPGEPVDHADVDGLGAPGLIFDSALNKPEQWLKLNEQKIKEKYARERDVN